MSSPLRTSSNIFGHEKIVRRAGAGDIDAILHLAKASSMTAHWSAAAAMSYCAAEGPDNTLHAKVIFVACEPVGPLSCLPAARRSARNPSGRPVGFAAFSAITSIGPRECALENLAVAEAWRKQGIGARLLVAGLLWCYAQSGSSLGLEVRASNHEAIAFYERAGFQANGRRSGYYTQPDDDAILMWKSLEASYQTP